MTTVTARTFRLLAEDLRDAIVDSYATMPDAPDMPNVKIVHGIVPPHDCVNCVLISFELFQRTPLASERKAVVPQARFHVEIVRRWPGEQNDADTEHYALGLLDDATVLQYGILARWRDGTLFKRFPAIRAESVRLEDMRPREGLGMAAGYYWRLTVDMLGADRVVLPAAAGPHSLDDLTVDDLFALSVDDLDGLSV